MGTAPRGVNCCGNPTFAEKGGPPYYEKKQVGDFVLDEIGAKNGAIGGLGTRCVRIHIRESEGGQRDCKHSHDKSTHWARVTFCLKPLIRPMLRGRKEGCVQLGLAVTIGNS